MSAHRKNGTKNLIKSDWWNKERKNNTVMSTL